MLTLDHIKLPVFNPESSAKYLARILKTKAPFQDPANPKIYTLKISSSTSIKFYPARNPGSVCVAFRVNQLVYGALKQQLDSMNIPYRVREIETPISESSTKIRISQHLTFSDINKHIYEVIY
jgi:hypothetical protein